MTIHEKHMEWIEARGLDAELAAKLGLETRRDETGFWLTVPYLENGETVNRKWRKTSEKRHRMDEGAPLLLWNADCLKDPKVQSGLAPVIITEGEWDAMAAIQCGFPFTVSVPNGAPAKLTDEPENAKRYDWVHRHWADLEKVRTFIIAVDADAAGYNLAADLAALLGAERCKFIEYPFPSKDLNEILLDHGQAKVAEVITHAKPYPIQGLFRLSDFPEMGEIRSYGCGVPAIADMIHIVPGTLTVVTGYANQGKSTLMNSIIGYALCHHFPVLLASFETTVKPIMRDGLRMAILGCGKSDLARADTAAVDRLLEDRLVIVTQEVDEDQEMDLDHFLELCRIAVVRDGVKMIVLDPWNELEHKRRRDESETEYISRALRAIKRFAKQRDVAFWIVAHPAKPMQGHKGIPGLYEISGSANWANKADYGMTYHRPKFDENKAKILVNKVRMGLPGRRGEVEVSYDFRTSRFVAPEHSFPSDRLVEVIQ